MAPLSRPVASISSPATVLSRPRTRSGLPDLFPSSPPLAEGRVARRALRVTGTPGPDAAGPALSRGPRGRGDGRDRGTRPGRRASRAILRRRASWSGFDPTRCAARVAESGIYRPRLRDEGAGRRLSTGPGGARLALGRPRADGAVSGRRRTSATCPEDHRRCRACRQGQVWRAGRRDHERVRGRVQVAADAGRPLDDDLVLPVGVVVLDAGAGSVSVSHLCVRIRREGRVDCASRQCHRLSPGRSA